MSQAYRFLPWARRGLAAALPVPAAGAAPPARGQVTFKVTVTADIVADRVVALLGPGDVIGIDNRLIVRTDPATNTVDAEPNYFAAIDFDLPDFPWLFTPASPGASQRLPPWLVLVVLDAERVAAPKVSAQRPLPWVFLEGELATTELPDLSQSWAWAHLQRLATSGDTADAGGLEQDPTLNVSRLICPRRLHPNRRYLACVVPAWDAGRDAGLGISGAHPEAPMAPAWTPATRDLTLPVYYHWEFATGEAGDFEALARRLKPRVISADLDADQARLGRIYLGVADDEQPELVAALPPEHQDSSIRFDAPLEALDRAEPTAADVPEPFATAISAAVSGVDARPLRPSIYGGNYPRRTVVTTDQLPTQWLDELNLDPRTRLGARLGGDVIRRFQEDLMHTAWEQVGDVLAANAQLSRSRFLQTVALRALERHTADLTPDRFLMLTSLMHQRVRVGDRTIIGQVAATSLPDRAFDPALRRMTSPVGRLARVAARALAPDAPSNTNPELSHDFASVLQRSAIVVDPGLAHRDGIASFTLGKRLAEQGWDSFAMPRWPDILYAAADFTDPIDTDLALRPRSDLSVAGSFTEQHLTIADRISAATGISAAQVLRQAAAAMSEVRDTVQIGVRRDTDGALQFRPIVREVDGGLSMVEPGGDRQRLLTMVALPGGAAPAHGTKEEHTLLVNLPVVAAGGLGVAGMVRMVDRRAEIGFSPVIAQNVDDVDHRDTRVHRLPAARNVVLRDAVPVWQRPVRQAAAPAAQPQARMFLDVMPPLAPAVVSRFESAYEATPLRLPAPDTAVFVPAKLGSGAGQPGLAATLRSAIDPPLAFRRRAAMLVTVPAWIDRTGAHDFDPISAAPVITVATADMLARTAPERLLPPELSIDDNTIAALKTNPRFVAAFMVGANHEMNRELLWRTYPTDGRGTSLTRFWNWFETDRHDVEDIHRWPEAGPLIERLAGGGTPQLVMVVRGRLLQRYPNTHLLAWKAKSLGTLEDVPADRDAARAVLRAPVFVQPIPPDITVAGFDLSAAEFQAGPGWYLMLQEPVTEARFGLDDNDDDDAARRFRLRPRRNVNDLSWSDVNVAPGDHVDPALLPDGGSTSASTAGSLLQRQVRFAVHASELADIL